MWSSDNSPSSFTYRRIIRQNPSASSTPVKDGNTPVKSPASQLSPNRHGGYWDGANLMSPPTSMIRASSPSKRDVHLSDLYSMRSSNRKDNSNMGDHVSRVTTWRVLAKFFHKWWRWRIVKTASMSGMHKQTINVLQEEVNHLRGVVEDLEAERSSRGGFGGNKTSANSSADTLKYQQEIELLKEELAHRSQQCIEYEAVLARMRPK
eukprot:PhF_6_TR10254/c0_g1_i1/m.15898